MRKGAGIFATIALIIALIGIWAKFAPVGTKSVTAAGVEPSISSIQSVRCICAALASGPTARVGAKCSKR